MTILMTVSTAGLKDALRERRARVEKAKVNVGEAILSGNRKSYREARAEWNSFAEEVIAIEDELLRRSWCHARTAERRAWKNL